MVRKKATSRLIEELEAMANLVSRSPLQNCGSAQNSGKSVNFHPSERRAWPRLSHHAKSGGLRNCRLIGIERKSPAGLLNGAFDPFPTWPSRTSAHNSAI